jgi:hypothetical protein
LPHYAGALPCHRPRGGVLGCCNTP